MYRLTKGDGAGFLLSVPGLPLCLCVLYHRALLSWMGGDVCFSTGPCCPGGGGPSSYQKNFLLWIFAYVVQFKILTFPEHVCLIACVGLPGLPPSEPRVRGLIT